MHAQLFEHLAWRNMICVAVLLALTASIDATKFDASTCGKTKVGKFTITKIQNNKFSHLIKQVCITSYRYHLLPTSQATEN